MPTLKRPYLNLILAPLWFLLVMILMSVYFVGQGIAEENVGLTISQHIPTLILCVQLLLFITLYLTSKKDNFKIFSDGWKSTNPSIRFKHILYGVLSGIVLAFLYIKLLSPLQTMMQSTFGDYVPAGETMKVLGTQSLIFFIANVVLAPFVEESVYRNYVLSRFLERYTVAKSIVLSSLFFGLLHWTGGFWYILMTALFVGLPFAFIVVKQKNILWVFIAHLTLNLIEFLYIALNA